MCVKKMIDHHIKRAGLPLQAKVVYLNVWPFREDLKCLLHNICLLLDLLYQKRNHLIMTIVDRSIFKKYLRLKTSGKNKILFLTSYYNDEIVKKCLNG